ncbi:MAG: hypothetical protein A3H02_03065 [Candidatus Niyogibacteria bacterium RIFCSPLOWO2_12_FULL_41_13]|uniref:Uncharacterized protein n=1 Tax=Candidatus Niyogibacteria bacterium RIFCSPLOWO2_12_FULL_41_13 TaxID=1801726 RepID=A0A1G2F2A7_9BACT|nr:MAG: hypothetical protein A3H02_03065 [Candidatus Niyogibacteria bacterium RIFCSPLOWO2_12_FULL_41_13]
MKTRCVAQPEPLSAAWQLWALQIANALFDPWNCLCKERQKTIKSAIQFLEDAQAGLKRVPGDLGDSSDEYRFQSDADRLVRYAFPNLSKEEKEKILARLNEILLKLVQNPELSITKDERNEVKDFFEKVANKGGVKILDIMPIEWRLFKQDIFG